MTGVGISIERDGLARDPIRWLLWVLGVAAGVSLLVYGARACCVFGDMHWFSTTGEEGLIIYNVWKAAHDHQVYQFGDRGVFDITLYNYLFFYGYGKFCALTGAEGDAMVSTARLLTLACGLLGAFAQWRIFRLLLGEVDRREHWLLLLCCSLTWYGTSFMSWWPITVRPDVLAAALATTGLWLFLASLRDRRWWLALVAVLPFYLAWGCKQSVVWMLTGAVLAALTMRGYRRQAFALALPLMTAFAITIALGTPEYRYQLLVVPSLSRIIPQDCFERFAQLLPPLAFFWIFAGLPVALRLKPNWAASLALPVPSDDASRARRVVITVAVVALAMGIVAIGKEGSGRNHLMEAVIAVSMLAATTLVRLLRAAPSRARNGVLWLAVVAAAILVMRPIHALTEPQLRGIRGGDERALVEHRALAQVLATLPRPVYLRDDILALPWYTTDNQPTAVLIDSVYYFAAKRRGLLHDNGIPGLVAQKRFAAILTRRHENFYPELIPAAKAAGYQQRQLDEPLLGLGYELWLRTDSVSPQATSAP